MCIEYFLFHQLVELRHRLHHLAQRLEVLVVRLALGHRRRLVILDEAVEVVQHLVDGVCDVQVPQPRPQRVVVVELHRRVHLLPLSVRRAVFVLVPVQPDDVLHHRLVCVLVQKRRQCIPCSFDDENR